MKHNSDHFYYCEHRLYEIFAIWHLSHMPGPNQQFHNQSNLNNKTILACHVNSLSSTVEILTLKFRGNWFFAQGPTHERVLLCGWRTLQLLWIILVWHLQELQIKYFRNIRLLIIYASNWCDNYDKNPSYDHKCGNAHTHTHTHTHTQIYWFKANPATDTSLHGMKLFSLNLMKYSSHWNCF